MNLNPIISQKPVVVVVASWLMILFGIGLILTFGVLGVLGSFWVSYMGFKPLLITMGTWLLPGISLILVGIGLKKMRRWAVHVLLILSIVSLYLGITGQGIIYMIFLVPFAMYCFFRRDLFN